MSSVAPVIGARRVSDTQRPVPPVKRWAALRAAILAFQAFVLIR